MKKNQFKLIKISSLFLFILIATQSCVVSSLHPLYTDSDRVHLDELDGVWISQDNERYEITTIADSLESKEIVLNTDYKFGAHKGDLGEINYAIRHNSKLKEEEFFEGSDKRSSENKKQLSKEDAFFNGTGGKKKKTITEEENAFFEGNAKNRSEDKDQMSKEERYFFNPQLRKYYQIRILTEKDTCVLDGRLSKLQGHYFLDVIPNEQELDKRLESYISGLILRTHGFFKLDLSGGELKVNAIEYDDFEDLLKNKKIRIEHIERDGEIIISAKTSDIQKFLVKFADTEMFNDPKEALLLKRVK